MRKIILYIATSLDSKIADENGGVDWLNNFANTDNSDYGYAKFYTSLDTIIMGNSTYKQILGFDIDFPYKSHKCYVFTKDKTLQKDENVEYIHSNFDEFIKKIKKGKKDKNIWLMGGGELNSLFIENKWLDEIKVFVMPIVLGNGIPLFSTLKNHSKVKFIDSKKHSSGAIELNYKI